MNLWEAVCDLWEAVCDLWEAACDLWEAACDLWEAACGRFRLDRAQARSHMILKTTRRALK